MREIVMNIEKLTVESCLPQAVKSINVFYRQLCFPVSRIVPTVFYRLLHGYRYVDTSVYTYTPFSDTHQQHKTIMGNFSKHSQ